jgi:hypothetical protein
VSSIIYKNKLLADLWEVRYATATDVAAASHPDVASGMDAAFSVVIKAIDDGHYDVPSPRCSVCGREIPPTDTPRVCVGCAEGETDERSKQ